MQALKVLITKFDQVTIETAFFIANYLPIVKLFTRLEGPTTAIKAMVSYVCISRHLSRPLSTLPQL